jgi:thioredoxin-related protein
VGNELASKFGVEYYPTFVFANADGSLSGLPIIGGVGEDVLRQRLDALQ